MKVAIYVRVSTQEQAQEGYSITAQTERLENYCKAKDWIIYDKYIDPGFTGSNMERPALKKMIDDTKKHKFDLLLVYKLDRLSRSQKDTLFLIEDIFLKNDIDFVSVNENFDTSTPFGRAMIGILSVFAQLEREQIKERTRMGFVTRTEKGKHHSYAPFGYRKENGNLIINPIESEVIREIYSLVASGESYSKIGKMMLAKYPQFKSHFAYSNSTRIREVLNIVTYGGYVKFGDTISKGNHEAIVDEFTYKKVRSLLEEREILWKSNRNRYSNTHSPYLLTGMIVCGYCGARYRVVPRCSGKKTVYTCYSRFGSPQHMVKDPNCTAPIFPMKELDTAVIDEIYKILLDENYFNEVTKRPTYQDNTLNEAKEEIKKIEFQLNKLLDLYQNSGFTSETVMQRIMTLEEKKKDLQSYMDKKTAKKKEVLSHAQFKENMSNFDSVVKSGATDDLRQMLRSLVEYIEVFEERLIFHWAF